MNMGKQVTFTFQPEPELLEALREQAEKQDRSVSWLVNYYIKKGLEADRVIGKKGKREKEA